MYNNFFLNECVIDEGMSSFCNSLSIDINNTIMISRYYRAYYGEDFEDVSFFIKFGDNVCAFILAYKINKRVCFSDGGAKIYIGNAVPKGIYHYILTCLKDISLLHKCKNIMISDPISSNNISTFSELLLSNKYYPEVNFSMIVDFSHFNEIDYFKNIRKSYKSLINWGKKNLILKTVNSNDLNNNLFHEFQQFHSKIAGRITRSKETWEIQYDLIVQGFGELILGYYNGVLVSGSFITEQSEYALYAVGVYERSLFDFGLSHYVLYNSICNAFYKGKKRYFCIGTFDPYAEDKKIWNIQNFKKGFCSEIRPLLEWKMTLNEI